MATGIEKLDKQIDRLEKLFSRRKRSADCLDSAVPAVRPATPIPFLTDFDASHQTFPYPSFIRPTSSRMMAREEPFLSPHSSRRARSLPESPSTPRHPASAAPAGSGNRTGSGALDGCPPLPVRYSSLGSDTPHRSSSGYPCSSEDDPSPELMDFSFPTPPRDTDRDSRGHSGLGTKSARPASISLSPKTRIDRKRYSGGAHPSPDEADGSAYSRVSRRPLSLSSRADIQRANKALRKSISLSGLPTAEVPGPESDPTLTEPSVTDFLTLSDDDIADGHASPQTKPQTKLRTKPPASNPPPKFGLPPKPSPTFTPSRTKAPDQMLTLSPPLASRPATAAAFEAARIATKHQFDLIYVVNLWPSHMSRPSLSSPLNQMCGTPVATSPVRSTKPSPPESPVSPTSGYDSGFESRAPAPRPNNTPRSGGMTGRLLAAYGLPSIMYPFRISAPVHQKVLRTPGWLEYRNGTSVQDEFARGYSCAFYTGHSPSRNTTPPADGNNKRHKTAANRGIVFAAFRLPREDGTPIVCEGAQLEALHADAEALVDMLIEIHTPQRRGREPVRRCVTGSGSVMGAPAGAPPLVAL